jgi:ribosomal protein S7
MNSSSSPRPEEEQPKGPNEDHLPHVSKEAAQTDRIVGEKCDGNTPGSPELEQGTPVDEILRRDKDALKYAPKVMQEQMLGLKGSRSYSTSATLRRQGLSGSASTQEDPSIAIVANMIAQVSREVEERPPGLKFDMPTTPLPKTENMRRRYDPLVEQFTKLLMRHGKLSVAQKNMAFILDHLRTTPPPHLHPTRRLLSAPPAPQLPLNPVLYLTLIVDSVAPLLKIRQQKGIAGGGAALQIPLPLALRQRRRTAIKWILDSAAKRRDSKLAQRVANELVSVAEGKSGVWDRREQVHKIGVAGRSNLKSVTAGGR